MKILTRKLSLFLALFGMLASGCTVTSDPEFSDTEITEVETFGWIYSELIIKGTDLDENCASNAVVLSKGSTNLALEIKECTSSAITAWIPEDMNPGVYNITAYINSNSFSSIDGTNMEVEVIKRPVILSMSKRTFDAGETITIEGLNFLNETASTQNNPSVWIMKTAYTNAVSEITVNEEGTVATIVVDEDLSPGIYNFSIRTDEWSNRLTVTIN